MEDTELTEWKPSFPFMEEFAGLLRKGRAHANQYEVKPWVPLIGGTGLGELALGRAPEGASRIAYDEPLTTGSGWTTQLPPDIIDFGLNLGAPALGMAKGAPPVARSVGRTVAENALVPTSRAVSELGGI